MNIGKILLAMCRMKMAITSYLNVFFDRKKAFKLECFKSAYMINLKIVHQNIFM